MNSENILDTNFNNEKPSASAVDIIKETWYFTKGKNWQIIKSMIYYGIILYILAAILSFVIGTGIGIIDIYLKSINENYKITGKYSYLISSILSSSVLPIIVLFIQNRTVEILKGNETNYKNIFSKTHNYFTLIFSYAFMSVIGYYLLKLVDYIIRLIFDINLKGVVLNILYIQLTSIIASFLLFFYMFSCLLIINKNLSGIKGLIKSLLLSQKIVKNNFIKYAIIFLFTILMGLLVSPFLIYTLIHTIFSTSIANSVIISLAIEIVYFILLYPFTLNILPVAYSKEKL